MPRVQDGYGYIDFGGAVGSGLDAYYQSSRLGLARKGLALDEEKLAKLQAIEEADTFLRSLELQDYQESESRRQTQKSAGAYGAASAAMAFGMPQLSARAAQVGAGGMDDLGSMQREQALIAERFKDASPEVQRYVLARYAQQKVTGVVNEARGKAATFIERSRKDGIYDDEDWAQIEPIYQAFQDPDAEMDFATLSKLYGHVLEIHAEKSELERERQVRQMTIQAKQAEFDSLQRQGMDAEKQSRWLGALSDYAMKLIDGEELSKRLDEVQRGPKESELADLAKELREEAAMTETPISVEESRRRARAILSGEAERGGPMQGAALPPKKRGQLAQVMAREYDKVARSIERSSGEAPTRERVIEAIVRDTLDKGIVTPAEANQLAVEIREALPKERAAKKRSAGKKVIGTLNPDGSFTPAPDASSPMGTGAVVSPASAGAALIGALRGALTTSPAQMDRGALDWAAQLTPVRMLAPGIEGAYGAKPRAKAEKPIKPAKPILFELSPDGTIRQLDQR